MRADARDRTATENRDLELRRVAERDREQFARAQRGVARARQRRRDELGKAVTGPGSLFSADVHVVREDGAVDDRSERIVAASRVEVPGMAEVSLGSRRSAEEIARAGFTNVGNACYVHAPMQMLLRTPGVVEWVRWHGSHPCTLRDAGHRERCVGCLMYRTVEQMDRSRGVKIAGPAPLAVGRRFVGEDFNNVLQWDAQEFALALMNKAIQQECDAGRECAWNAGLMHGDCRATHLDRLLSFVVEQRKRCVVCGVCTSRCERAQSLDVTAVAPTASSPFTVSEMILKELGVWRLDERNRAECSVCCERTIHEMQRRLVQHAWPNSLLVCVKRGHGENAQAEGALVRHKVVVDEELSLLPGMPRMTLCGVVYHSGETVNSGHYTAACRGTGGRYWMYDDIGRVPAVSIDLDISTWKPKQVHMLMYCRSDLVGARGDDGLNSGAGGPGGAMDRAGAGGGGGARGVSSSSGFAGNRAAGAAGGTGAAAAAGSEREADVPVHGGGGGRAGTRGQKRKGTETEGASSRTPGSGRRRLLRKTSQEAEEGGVVGDIGGVAVGSSGPLMPRGSPASSDPRARQAFAAAASGEDGGGAQTPSRRLRAKTLPGSAERLGSGVHAREVVAGEGGAADMSASARRRLRSKTCPGSGEEEWFCELRGSEGLGTVASQDLKTAGEGDVHGGGASSSLGAGADASQVEYDEEAHVLNYCAEFSLESRLREVERNRRQNIFLGMPEADAQAVHDRLKRSHEDMQEKYNALVRAGRLGDKGSEASDSGLACSAGAESAASPAPASAGVGAANEGGASGTGHVVGGGRGSRAGRGPSGRAAGGVRGGRGRRAPDEQAEVPRREEAGVRRSARIQAQGTREQLPKSQPSAAGATIRGGILSRPARGSSEVVSATQPSASGTAVSPARTRQRIVCGFGNERVPDLAQFQRERAEEQLQRGVQRVREGVRGRMVDREGNELDRSQGGAFSIGSGRGRGGGK